ncbi:hypothetical protein B9479_001882 [Cryptococcus floricola]|uniref:NADPH-dependent FMN reductase-like domain-containing protein n=1 Tax=Cryptococcus floricola TaxID=2591691 RepID=A0A5D3B5B0_9TREE|nr:hypothetical protein B9479_001882 [Cryptococcus floricola]
MVYRPPTSPAPYRIGVLLGSNRHLSNTQGFSVYLTNLIAARFPFLHPEVIHLENSQGHPLPYVLSDEPPARHSRESLPGAYDNERVCQWSATVLAWDGLIILSPQYNSSYPAPLKNALDHLYHEWSNLPCAIMSLGGGGGGRLRRDLKVMCGGSFDMKVVEEGVEVAIPGDLIVGKKRIEGDEEFLKRYDEGAIAAVEALVGVIRRRKGVEEGDVIAAQMSA